jgi:hypothetical protein
MHEFPAATDSIVPLSSDYQKQKSKTNL